MRQLVLKLSVIIFTAFTTSSASIFNADDDFIEQIFEVKIPGLEGAYNASIVEYEDGYLMAFRYDTYVDFDLHLSEYYQYIGIIRLDENFQAIGPWYPFLGARNYDPRLIKIEDIYYLIFASPKSTENISVHSSHLEMCTFKFSDHGISIESLIELEAPCQQKWEKNWAPFVYKNKILLSYSIDPHIVLKPSLVDGSCEITSKKSSNIYWPYGIIRGGTPAKLIDGHYLGFFHSSYYSYELGCFNYSVGAYVYSAKPPFEIQKISTRPFSHTDFYSSTKGVFSNANVLFPGGFVEKGEKIYLCYGENDIAIKIMVINKNSLYKNLGL